MVKRPAGTKAVVVAAERSNSVVMEDLGTHMIVNSIVLIDMSKCLFDGCNILYLFVIVAVA